MPIPKAVLMACMPKDSSLLASLTPNPEEEELNQKIIEGSKLEKQTELSAVNWKIQEDLWIKLGGGGIELQDDSDPDDSISVEPESELISQDQTLPSELQSTQIRLARDHSTCVHDGFNTVRMNKDIREKFGTEKYDRNIQVSDDLLNESVRKVDFSAPFLMNFTRMMQEYNYRKHKPSGGGLENKRCAFKRPTKEPGVPVLRLSKLLRQGKTIVSSLPIEKVVQKFSSSDTQFENVAITREGNSEFVTAFRHGNDLLFPCNKKNCRHTQHPQDEFYAAEDVDPDIEILGEFPEGRPGTDDITSPLMITNVKSLATPLTEPSPSDGQIPIPSPSRPQPVVRKEPLVVKFGNPPKTVPPPTIPNQCGPSRQIFLKDTKSVPVPPAITHIRNKQFPAASTQPMPIILVPSNNANRRKTNPKDLTTDHAMCSYVPILPKGQQRVMATSIASAPTASALLQIQKASANSFQPLTVGVTTSPESSSQSTLARKAVSQSSPKIIDSVSASHHRGASSLPFASQQNIRVVQADVEPDRAVLPLPTRESEAELPVAVESFGDEDENEPSVQFVVAQNIFETEPETEMDPSDYLESHMLTTEDDTNAMSLPETATTKEQSQVPEVATIPISHKAKAVAKLPLPKLMAKTKVKSKLSGGLLSKFAKIVGSLGPGGTVKLPSSTKKQPNVISSVVNGIAVGQRTPSKTPNTNSNIQKDVSGNGPESLNTSTSESAKTGELNASGLNSLSSPSGVTGPEVVLESITATGAEASPKLVSATGNDPKIVNVSGNVPNAYNTTGIVPKVSSTSVPAASPKIVNISCPAPGPKIISTSGAGTAPGPKIISTSGAGTGTVPKIISTSCAGTAIGPKIISTSGAGTGTGPKLLAPAAGTSPTIPTTSASTGVKTTPKPAAEFNPKIVSTRGAGVKRLKPAAAPPSEFSPIIVSTTGAGIGSSVKPVTVTKAGVSASKPSQHISEGEKQLAQQQHLLRVNMTAATIAEKAMFPLKVITSDGSTLLKCRTCSKTFPGNCLAMYENHMLSKHAVAVNGKEVVSVSKFPGPTDVELHKCHACHQIITAPEKSNHRLRCCPSTPEESAFRVVQNASKSTASVPLFCGLCKKSFDSRIGLRQHITGCHQDLSQKLILDPQMRCAICLLKFDDTVDLTLHSSECTNRRASRETMLELAKGMLECEVCAKSRRHHESIQATQECYSKTGLIRCLLCHNTVVSRGNFFHHMRTYHDRGSVGIVCPFCDVGEMLIKDCFVHILDAHYTPILVTEGLIKSPSSVPVDRKQEPSTVNRKRSLSLSKLSTSSPASSTSTVAEEGAKRQKLVQQNSLPIGTAASSVTSAVNTPVPIQAQNPRPRPLVKPFPTTTSARSSRPLLLSSTQAHALRPGIPRFNFVRADTVNLLPVDRNSK